MDALAAEFPGAASALAPLRRLAVSRAGVWRAFLSGIGAAFLVRAIAQVLLVVLYPIVFPVTAPRPVWLTTSLFWDAAGELAAGMVLVRAGGLAPLALYVLLEVLVVLAAFPGRLLACSGNPDLFAVCDLPAMLGARWPLWLALLAGALASGVLARRDDGDSPLLVAAGAFSFVATVATSLATLVAVGAHLQQLTFTGLYAVAEIMAGLAAGALLWRVTATRPLLLALCLVGPGLALSLPLVRTSLQHPPTSPQPIAYYLSVWAGVAIPAGAAIAVFAGRALRREWRTVL